jgi:hypothetical protein
MLLCYPNNKLLILIPGCVYYFVLTNGSHPFGESFRRQANILTGEFCLDKMFDERWSTARALIEKMISVEHTHRPTTTAVLRHPMFWPSEKVLNFLQDVSDRVDKESFDSAIVASLERNKLEVVRNNWYDLLDVQVSPDAFDIDSFFTFILISDFLCYNLC